MDSDRFNDLLDEFPAEDGKAEEQKKPTSCSKVSLPRQMDNNESSSGPLHWNTRCSVELQQVVDQFKTEDLYDLDFSVTVADPSQPDCPLVACSMGFTELTGYKVHEIVGRNCRFLLNGVPTSLVDEETRLRCRSFCVSVSQGKTYDDTAQVLPAGVEKSWFNLPKGELICVQTNATKTGELFRNMFYIKQVELDDTAFILGLQAGIPEDYVPEGSEGLQKLQEKCQDAWLHLDANMATIEQVLAAQFWYQAPMRRQE
jgi:hypothetical protein